MALTYQRWAVDPDQDINYTHYPPEPCPNSMQTTVTMDLGVYDYCHLSRGADASLTEKYDWDLQFDFGTQSVDAGTNKTCQGLTIITPAIKAHTASGNHILKANIYCKKISASPDVEVRLRAAFYKWQIDDTKGTVWSVNKNGGFMNTVISMHTVSQVLFTGHTFSDGDRVAIDLWVQLYNNGAFGINARWCYLYFGNTYPSNIQTTKAGGYQMMPIMQQVPVWGSL